MSNNNNFDTLNNFSTNKVNVNSGDVILTNYARYLVDILEPIRSADAKQNCDKLFFVLNQKGDHRKQLINPNNGDIFNRVKLPKQFNVEKEFKKAQSQIQGAENVFTFYDLLDFFELSLNQSTCIVENVDVLRQTGYSTGKRSSVSPIVLSSDSKEFMTQAITTSELSRMRKHTGDIQECIRKKKILVGFINIYSKVLDMGHKNGLIIDTKNKVIVHFEPKAPGFASSVAVLTRHKMNEEIIRINLSHFPQLDSYKYIKIYGNQSSIDPLTYDAVYCVLYSLYFGLLFVKNYDVLNRKLQVAHIPNNAAQKPWYRYRPWGKKTRKRKNKRKRKQSKRNKTLKRKKKSKRK